MNARFLRLIPPLVVLNLCLVTHAHPLRGVELGASAPGFELKDSRGKALSLAGYKGKVVVLAYVRSGQPLSARVLDALTKMRQTYPPADVAMLAVRQPGEDGAVPAGEAKLPFPVLLDPDRALYGSWGLFVLPTTVVLDRRHAVAAAFSTFPEGMEDEIAAAVDKTLGRARVAAKPKHEAAAAAPEIGMARKLLADGRAAQAYETLGPALRSPTPDALILACEALLALGRIEEATPRCEAALKAEPGSLRTSLLMGRVRTLQGRYPEAETLLKAASLSPNGAEAHYRLGQLYERQGRKDAALVEYRTALERSHGR